MVFLFVLMPMLGKYIPIHTWHHVQFIISIMSVCNPGLFQLLVSLQYPPRHCYNEFLPWSVWSPWRYQYPGAEGTLGQKAQSDSQRVGADRTTLLPTAGAGHHCTYCSSQKAPRVSMSNIEWLSSSFFNFFELFYLLYFWNSQSTSTLSLLHCAVVFPHWSGLGLKKTFNWCYARLAVDYNYKVEQQGTIDSPHTQTHKPSPYTTSTFSFKTEFLTFQTAPSHTLRGWCCDHFIHRHLHLLKKCIWLRLFQY